MTPAQRDTLLPQLKADPAANAILQAGDTFSLLAWLNQPTATDAWKPAVTGNDLFGKLSIATYDNLTAGKRDAFNLLLNRQTVDATLAPIRNGLADIFAVTGAYTDAAQLGKMLAACIEKATKAQSLLGGTTPAAVGGVQALKRNFSGLADADDANYFVNN